MAIQILQENIMFKIDFIVWKQTNMPMGRTDYYLFKIDFIVWKLNVVYTAHIATIEFKIDFIVWKRIQLQDSNINNATV